MREVPVLETRTDGETPHPTSLREATFSREREKEQRAPIVQIDRVSKTFATSSGPVRALDDVSLEIARNAFFTLLGPSGCGKTTLLRLIAGFEHPDAGMLRLDGKDVDGDPPNKRPVNIVFQSYALFPHMSVVANIAFGLERLGLKRAEIATRIDTMLALVRLEGLAGRKPAQLSGGQQQRVALARALAPNPKLLLLDEPLSALDVKLRRGMQVELKRIQRETGITFLLVTHDQEEALSMSDEIALMGDGRIVQLGTPRDIYERPRSCFAADFMGANVLPGDLVGRPFPHAAIRPERVDVAIEGEGLPGRVVEVTYLGATTSCLIKLDEGPTLKAEGERVPALLAGNRVFCRLPPDALVALGD